MIHKRNRLLYSILIVGTLFSGLISRKIASELPLFINTYLGDSLWALMIFWGVAFLFNVKSTNLITGISLSFCYLIEISQLYHAPWIDTVRATTLGGLVLGYEFVWTDLVAYTIGISLGILIEYIFIKKR